MIELKKMNKTELEKKVAEVTSTVTSEKLLQYITLIIEALSKKERIVVREIEADIMKLEGSNFKYGVFVTAINIVRDSLDPLDFGTWLIPCPNCSQNINKFSKKCPLCTAKLRCSACNSKIHLGTTRCICGKKV